jgi:hypothetical protein
MVIEMVLQFLLARTESIPDDALEKLNCFEMAKVIG